MAKVGDDAMVADGVRKQVDRISFGRQFTFLRVWLSLLSDIQLSVHGIRDLRHEFVSEIPVDQSDANSIENVINEKANKTKIMSSLFVRNGSTL